MAMLKYKELLSMAKDKVTELMAPMRSNEMRKRAELEICKLESTIAEKEQKIQELASKYPIDFDKMLDAIDEVDLIKRRQQQFETIIAEMFSDDA